MSDICKVCYENKKKELLKQADKRFYKKHKEKINKYTREYYADNQEKLIEFAKNNPNRYENDKKYYSKNSKNKNMLRREKRKVERTKKQWRASTHEARAGKYLI